MACLEGRLNSLRNNIVAPAKEGGLSALDGVKIGERIGIGIYTIPKYHHSFSHLKNAMNNVTDQIFKDTVKRCEDECKVQLDLIHGENMKHPLMLSQCTNEMASAILGESLLKQRSCLAEKSKNDIEYETVLECKKKAFNLYLDEVVELNQTALIKALNKFA